MKWNMFLGALVVSVGLCSQSFGFELLDRMLGLHYSSGCCGQQPCCEATCEPACCEPACCEPVCDTGCNDSCDPCCKRDRCDLFAGLRGLFDCNRCCEPACESACDTCSGGDACGCNDCGPRCRKNRCGLDLLGLFRCKKSCCDTGCNTCGHGGGGGYHDGGHGVPDEAAPLPPAPMPDSQASFNKTHRRVARTVASR